jgi:L-malate glycosyltransferase
MDHRPARKILVISHEYPPIGGGGGRVIQDLCEGMASVNNTFYILTAQYDDLPQIETQEFLTVERLRSCRKEAFRASLTAMVCFVWKSFWRALRLIHTWNPDLIHAHFAVPGGASAALAAIITRTPFILTIHGGDVPGGAPEKTDRWFKIIKPFTGFIWKKAIKVIAVSEVSKQLALKHYPVEIKVIPNGIDRHIFQNDPANLQKPPHILFIGRFSPEKNAIAMPEILKHLLDLDWKCTMIGDGPQWATLDQKINQHNLSERFHLTGWLPQESVNRLLTQADILIMPSLRESMPMAGLQALAAGNALIMSNVGACPEMVVSGKNGYLFHPQDIQGFAQAVRKLLSDSVNLKEFKENSMEYSRKFDIRLVLDHYRDIYQEVSAK